MISANELRIGNWVELKNSGFVKIDSDNISDVVNNPAIFNAIELTPEILEACGFEKRDQRRFVSFIYIVYDNRMAKHLTDWRFLIITENAEEQQLAYLQYLHQLQNIYCALRGEELKIDQLHFSLHSSQT